MQFEATLTNCKAVADNKLTISEQLLRDLCSLADLILGEYDATLAKVMFLAAWGGFMQISEYTRVRTDQCDHNVLTSSVDVTGEGLGITFITDKTSTATSPPRHCMVYWDSLPEFAQGVFTAYEAIKPVNTLYYFVQMDGQPVMRNNFNNMLDACVFAHQVVPRPRHTTQV